MSGWYPNIPDDGRFARNRAELPQLGATGVGAVTGAAAVDVVSEGVAVVGFVVSTGADVAVTLSDGSEVGWPVVWWFAPGCLELLADS